MRDSSRLRLQQLALLLQLTDALLQLHFDVLYGKRHLLLRCNEVLRGIYLDVVALAQQLAGQRVHYDNALDLVPPELYADAEFFISRHYFHRVAANSEVAACEVHVVALVLHVHELSNEQAAVSHLTLPHIRDEALVLFRRAEAEYTGDGCHDESVSPCEQGASGGVSELVQLLVDVGVLLDVCVGARDVGFRLVVVVVADEVFDRVVREELLELGGELRRKRLVVRDDERWALCLLDDIRHREGLAAAGDAHKRLVRQSLVNSGDGLRDSVRLVARRLEV